MASRDVELRQTDAVRAMTRRRGVDVHASSLLSLDEGLLSSVGLYVGVD